MMDVALPGQLLARAYQPMSNQSIILNDSENHQITELVGMKEWNNAPILSTGTFLKNFFLHNFADFPSPNCLNSAMQITCKKSLK